MILKFIFGAFMVFIVGAFPVFAEDFDQQCDSIELDIKKNIVNGHLLKGNFSRSIPSVRTDFKFEGKNISVPLMVVDLDGDGIYEVLYLIDIALPQHVMSKVYLLHSLSEIYALDLINKKYDSEQYDLLMHVLEQKYKWNALKDLINLNSLVIPYRDFFPGLESIDKGIKLTIYQFEGRAFLIVDKLDTKEIALLTVNNVGASNYKIACKFKY